jgi:hypothetical protein
MHVFAACLEGDHDDCHRRHGDWENGTECSCACHGDDLTDEEEEWWDE